MSINTQRGRLLPPSVRFRIGGSAVGTITLQLTAATDSETTHNRQKSSLPVGWLYEGGGRFEGNNTIRHRGN